LNWLVSLGLAKKKGKTFMEYQKSVAGKSTETEATPPSHLEIQNMIADLGIMNGYDVRKEYRINNDRVDVL
jgi:hypothetical protein